jgi:formiminotetrahydrofolate cyclodeaminase
MICCAWLMRIQKHLMGIMNAMSLPKGTDEEKAVRKQAMNEATKLRSKFLPCNETFL